MQSEKTDRKVQAEQARTGKRFVSREQSWDQSKALNLAAGFMGTPKIPVI